MDQEAEIFKPMGTQKDCLTRSTARSRARRTKIEAAILEGRLFSYWWVITTLVLCFSFGTRQLTTHTHINKSGQDSDTKTFSELYQFLSRFELRGLWGSHVSTALQSAFTNYFTICLKIFAIQTTNQSLVSSCLRWLQVTWDPNHKLSSVIKFIKRKLYFLTSKFRLFFSNPQAATAHVNELSLFHTYWDFRIESIAWKTHTEISSSNRNRETTFHPWEKRFIQSEISCQNESVNSQTRPHFCSHLFNLHSQKFVEFP